MPELEIISLLALFTAIVGVLPFWFICKKAGLPPWLSLIMFIPIGSFILPYFVAFIGWPALRADKSAPTQP